MTIAVENGFCGGGPSVAISRSAFKKWDGSSLEIPLNDQARILANFKAAMEFQGIAVEV